MRNSNLTLLAKAATVGAALSIMVFGCSAKDKPTFTPIYHYGTMTNSSTVNSWELNTDPTHTQPGAYHGAPATLRTVPSLRGYEPYDPLAVTVFSALSADNTLNTRYLSAGAKNGVVVLVGTVPTKAQRVQAENIAKKVAGVHEVRDQIAIQAPSS